MATYSLPVSMDRGLLLLPTSPPSGFRHHPQLLWSAAGGFPRTTGVCPHTSSSCRAYQGGGPWSCLECLVPHDGTLAGSPGDLAAALHIIERDGPSVGLYLNRAKSLLFIPEEADASLSPLPPDIPITRGGCMLLGCPVGPPSYCEEVFRRRVAKVKFSLGILRDIGDSQLEFTLLRSCLALPKVSFILRTCPPSHISLSAIV